MRSIRNIKFDVVRATSIRQIREASALRYDVYAGVMPAKGIINSARREITPYDMLDRTHHLIAYDGSEAVATLRVILPASFAAQEDGTTYGLSMEDHVSFDVIRPGQKFCEFGRLAIRPDYRGTDVLRLMYKELHNIIEDNEIQYFGGPSMMGTNKIEDANRFFDIIDSHGLCARDIWVSSVGRFQGFSSKHGSLREDISFQNSINGKLISLPKLVRYYLKTGFRVCGRPFYDDRYDGCFLPMVSTPSGLRSVRFGGRTIMD